MVYDITLIFMLIIIVLDIAATAIFAACINGRIENEDRA